MSEQCDCPLGDSDRFIICPRHGIKKYRRQVELCRKRGKYWRAFEAGWKRDGSEPAPVKKPREPAVPGPGSNLRAIIAGWQARLPWFDLTEYPGCKCGETAKLMDQWGPDGCEANMDTLLDRLETEAQKRHISVPFRRTVARAMVNRAIQQTRKATASLQLGQSP